MSDQAMVRKIFSLAIVGGDPELVMQVDSLACAISMDGKRLAVFRKNAELEFNIEISDPIGSPFVRYQPAPFTSKLVYGRPQLSFSPNGKNLLLLQDGADNKQAGWLLPYPALSGPSQRILPELASLKNIPNLAWMPDSRHLVISMSVLLNKPSHIWLTDIRSSVLYPLTNGIADESAPRPSPDGKTLLFTSLSRSFDVVSLSVSDGSVKTVVSTGHLELMASWSAKNEKMVWVTDRTGGSEIWLRSQDGEDRPIITVEQFPGERLMNPTLSPGGDRIIFAKSDLSGIIRLWIASVAGAPPIRLTKDEGGSEFGGSWSPDGSQFVFVEASGGKTLLRIVKTSGGATPVTVKEGSTSLPEWSPSGDRISCSDGGVWDLTSPDGKRLQSLGRLDTDQLVFSKDGKRLYGILKKDPKTNRNAAMLFSLDPVTHTQTLIRDLGSDLQPASNVDPGIRFSMSPDGKSFLYSTDKRRADIWMLQGFRQPSWLDRFSLH